MRMRKAMRTKPEGTGPINWILSSQWWVMPWGWGTSGGFRISPFKMEEVRIPFNDSLIIVSVLY